VHALPDFWLIDTKNPWLIVLASVVTITVAHAAVFTPLAAWFSEMFGSGLRYSGSSVGFRLGALVAGGPNPFIAIALPGRTRQPRAGRGARHGCAPGHHGLRIRRTRHVPTPHRPLTRGGRPVQSTCRSNGSAASWPVRCAAIERYPC
jgi:hypothetical protein